jgi:hypothetical protein
MDSSELTPAVSNYERDGQKWTLEDREEDGRTLIETEYGN